MADGTDMAAVIWLDHDRIRLYGFMGLLSKMLDWTGYPKDCYNYLSTCSAKK